MTALATLYTREIIFMAADSLEVELDDYENRRVMGVRETQKLFLLQKTATGISVSGYASWDDKTVRDILGHFLKVLDHHHPSQAAVAEGLCSFLNTFYGGLRSRFHLCGFDDREPFVALLDYQEEGGHRLQRVNVNKRGVVRGGILTFCEWETHKYARGRLPDLEILRTADAIHFIHGFFDHEMDLVRKTKEVADVGGPVDVLILTPGWQSYHAVKNLREAILI